MCYLQTCTSSLYKLLIDGLDSYCRCFYQLFGLSFWRHPFTAEDPLVREWCNDELLQIMLSHYMYYIILYYIAAFTIISKYKCFLFALYYTGCVNDRQKQLQQLLKPFPGQKRTWQHANGIKLVWQTIHDNHTNTHNCYNIHIQVIVNRSI